LQTIPEGISRPYLSADRQAGLKFILAFYFYNYFVPKGTKYNAVKEAEK
jgi:hypothetical protein